MAKSNNGLYAGIAVAVVVIVAVVVGVLVMNRKNTPVDNDIDSANVVEPTTNNNTNNDSNVQDLSVIDETIEFGDYDSMMILSKSIQNGEATDKVVKIEGIVSHPMSNYSIVQISEDGTQSVGTQFVIEGMTEDDYPDDGEHIVLTGRVIEKEPMYFVIQTWPEYILEIENDGELEGADDQMIVE